MSDNNEFEHIINNLDMDDLIDPRNPDGLSIWEVHQGALSMSQALMVLNKFLMDHISDPDESLPEQVVPLLRELTSLCDDLVSVIVGCDCPECRDCDECGNDLYCDECLVEIELEILDQEDDDE